MSDPTDATTFTELQHINNLSQENWQEYTVTFENYNGTDQYIAIKHTAESSSKVILFDDFVYELNPTADVEEQKVTTVSIYPNPAKNFLHVQSNTSIQNIEIYNLLGKEVLTNNNVNTKNKRLDVSFLEKGIYIVKMNNIARKFIKN